MYKQSLRQIVSGMDITAQSDALTINGGLNGKAFSLSGAENSKTDETQDEKTVTFENSIRVSMRSFFLREA